MIIQSGKKAADALDSKCILAWFRAMKKPWYGKFPLANCMPLVSLALDSARSPRRFVCLMRHSSFELAMKLITCMINLIRKFARRSKLMDMSYWALLKSDLYTYLASLLLLNLRILNSKRCGFGRAIRLLKPRLPQ